MCRSLLLKNKTIKFSGAIPKTLYYSLTNQVSLDELTSREKGLGGKGTKEKLLFESEQIFSFLAFVPPSLLRSFPEETFEIQVRG